MAIHPQPACVTKQFGIETPNCRFCGTHAPVLDCANGEQEEIQEEGDEIEENCRQEVGAGEGAGKEGKNSQEVGKEKAREKGDSEKEGLGY